MVNKDNAYIGSVVKDSKPKDYSPQSTFVQLFWEINNNFSGTFCKTFYFFSLFLLDNLGK